MNILITGATGLIGRHLAERLTCEQADLQVTALSRNPEQAARTLPKGTRIISSLENVNFNALDVVVNLAGEPIADKRWTSQQKQRICESRWHITEAISNAINQRNSPPAVFISGSAIGYYGTQASERISEDFNPQTKDFSHAVCDKWESLAKQCDNKTRVCLLRTGVVLSQKGGALKKMLPAFKFGLGGPIASGAQFMSWIHIDDMVSIIIELINNPALSGPINATAPEPVSNNEFSHALASTLRRPCFFRVPQFLLDLSLGELSALLVHGQRVIPQKLKDSGFKFTYPNIHSAMKSLLG